MEKRKDLTEPNIKNSSGKNAVAFYKKCFLPNLPHLLSFTTTKRYWEQGKRLTLNLNYEWLDFGG